MKVNTGLASGTAHDNTLEDHSRRSSLIEIVFCFSLSLNRRISGGAMSHSDGNQLMELMLATTIIVLTT